MQEYLLRKEAIGAIIDFPERAPSCGVQHKEVMRTQQAYSQRLRP